MTFPNNPAGRLLRVVEVLSGGNPNTATKEVLGTALEVN